MWKINKVTSVLKTPPFDVEEVDLEIKPGHTELFYRLRSLDWVNVLAVTGQKAILIKQFRVGVDKYILETPGGRIEAGEKDATMSAVRELEEETGFTSKRLLPLGVSYPNPAIQNNQVHMFLALDCVPASPRKYFPDAAEDIEVVLYDLKDLDSMIRSGQINHGISALTILLARKYIQF